MSLYLNLFGQNVVADFFPRFSDVRSLAHHAFISDDSHCKIVDSHTMILPAHHFRSHIAWCTRGFLGVVRIPNPCNTEICHSQVAFVIKDKIFRFDISMQDALSVHIFQCNYYASNEELSLFLIELAMPSDVISQIPAT